MEISVDTIRDHIPYYLTEEQKVGLARALRDFDQSREIYFDPEDTGLVRQGDGWTKFELVQIQDSEAGSSYNTKNILGIVLSNTCDISPKNQRDFPPRITFAPIIPLEAYINLLASSGIDGQKIADKVAAIKDQKVTNVFYLRPGAGLREEYIAIFDDLHSMPTDRFYRAEGKARIFSLNLVGFYLFLLKLSVHFCRFNENLGRA